MSNPPAPFSPATPAPAIPIRNAWYLLLYAWDMAQWRGPTRQAAEESPDLLSLLARVLSISTREILRRNLARAFSSDRRTIRGVRGRIDFGRSLKRLDFEAGKAHCRFPSLDVDILRNRIIRSTLNRLARDPRLATATGTDSRALRDNLRELVDQMDGVDLIPLSSAHFRQLQVGRNDEAYALPLAICGLVFRLELPTESPGDDALASLLRDQLIFKNLFERFVRNFWKLELRGYDVQSEHLQWFDAVGSSLMPSMFTDITLTSTTPPYRRLVVDTKYYREALARGRFGGLRFNSDNLYQIYAYLRTQEHRSDSHLHADGMLLYPLNGFHLDEIIQLQTHRIRVATIDLAAPWPSIHTRLLALATPF